jgi:hemoglobin
VFHKEIAAEWRTEENMNENLLEQIGGRHAVQRATELFYNKVLDDDQLQHFFRRTDMAHLRSRQVMFISMLLGGKVYTGKDIHKAHALARDQGLDASHFDLFLRHFREALEEVGVKSENAERIIHLLESKRNTVVG